jgi:putative heme-binding domain-containing protein
VQFRLVLPILWLVGLASPAAGADSAIVETLLRLKHIDVNARPELKEAVLRHLETVRGTARYVELVRRLGVRGVEEELQRLALSDPSGSVGVSAAAILLERGELQRFERQLAGDEETAAVNAATVLGFVVAPAAQELLRPLVTNLQRSRAVRIAAARGLGRSLPGQRFLLDLVAVGRLPADLRFAVADALTASPDPVIRREVLNHLQLPAAADRQPVPPVARLVELPGDPVRGETIFRTTGACSKCHKVRGEGKEVGPDLSEIGSKLSAEAIFVSILDPSAGVSHNYETYVASMNNGLVVSGLLVNRTDEQVTLRTSEAIDVTIPSREIDQLLKSDVSLMPADLQKGMSAQDLVDVVAYLGTLRALR